MIGFQVLYVEDHWMVGVYQDGRFIEFLTFRTIEALTVYMNEYVLSNYEKNEDL